MTPRPDSSYWRAFCNEYFSGTATTEEDLLQQAGYTVNKKPIPYAKVRELVQRISLILELRPSDCLVDFCCGNGLLDYELAPSVRSVIGIDFAESVIATARRLKQRQNITYQVGSATDPLTSLIGSGTVPDKFLMAGALAYLQPEEFDRVLRNIREYLGDRGFRFLVVGIPNQRLQANFYDTPERLARHLENERTLPDTNDGLGRWWRVEEIEAICAANGLSVQIANQPANLSNYRMDALIGGA